MKHKQRLDKIEGQMTPDDDVVVWINYVSDWPHGHNVVERKRVVIPGSGRQQVTRIVENRGDHETQEQD